MNYLRCIWNLNQALDALNANRQGQVDTSKVEDLIVCLQKVDSLLGDNKNATQQFLISALRSALVVAQEQKKNTYLTDGSRSILCSGFFSIKRDVVEQAYDYYTSHDIDVPLSDEHVKQLKDIVDTHYGGGYEYAF